MSKVSVYMTRLRYVDGVRAALAAGVVLGCWAAGCSRPAMLLPSETRSAPPPAPAAPEGAALPAAPPRQVDLGKSVMGQPLVLEVFGTGPQPVLILGGFHGDEASGADVARRLAALLREDPAAAQGRPVAVLAPVNPDGLTRGTRANANGVDLNRNFPAQNWRPSAAGRRYFGGRQPASEPEVRAVMWAVEWLRPGLVISLHARARGPCNNYDGPAGRPVAERMARHNGYPVVATIGYPTPGSLGNWAGIDQRIPMVTLELPGRLGGRPCWRANREALLAAVGGHAAPPTPSAPAAEDTALGQ